MKTIFFDLDDTLYFRCDAFFQAFEEFFDKTEFPSDEYTSIQKKANDRCRIRGDEVFYQSQRGEITMDQMYVYRFQNGFADCNIHITEQQALDFHSLYKQKLYSLKLNDDVVKMLDYSKSHFDRIGIITNGPGTHQRNKIKNLGLEKWLDPDLIIVSGEHKVDKPDLEIFKIAQKLSGRNPEELVFVGDNFNNDIIPAQKLGWHTVWIDLYDENYSAPEWQVKKVEEIIPVLKKIN